MQHTVSVHAYKLLFTASRPSFWTCISASPSCYICAPAAILCAQVLATVDAVSIAPAYILSMELDDLVPHGANEKSLRDRSFPEDDSVSDRQSSPSGSSSMRTSNSMLEYKSALSILQTTDDGVLCHVQAFLVVCDKVPLETTVQDIYSRKRKLTSTEVKVSNFILVDKTGPIAGSFRNDAAEAISKIWCQAPNSRKSSSNKPVLIEVKNVRILQATQNAWNGALHTLFSTLTSVQQVSTERGTLISVLETPTAPNLTSMTFSVPPSDCCVSAFQALRGKVKPPFRVTVRGTTVDLQPPESTQKGEMKRVFCIVDSSGLYVTCCATHHNVSSVHLRNGQEAILYYCLGRWSTGRSQGMLFLMHDALIVPVRPPSELIPKKVSELSWDHAQQKDSRVTTRLPNRVTIHRDLVQKEGATQHCRGCQCALQSLPAGNHTEACRKRFENIMRRRGGPSLARADLRCRKG